MPYIAGLYTGIEYFQKVMDNPEDVKTMDELLDLYVEANQQDSIVSIFTMPTDFFSNGEAPATKDFGVARPTNLNGYTPRNKKLLTYPYMFLTMDCNNDSKNYRYEFSGYANGEMNFVAFGCVSPNVEIICCPRNYNGSGSAELDGETVGTANITEALVMTGFPQCAFTIDAYRAYVAQKANADIISGVGQLGLGVASAISGHPTGVAFSGIGLAQTINSAVIEATKGSTSRGNQGGSALVASRSKNFYLKQMCITNEYAQMIDSFFDKYGYAVDRLKIPFRHARKYWTYVKTRDCNAIGSVPADDMKKINEIYNAGITFWSHPNMVGDYSKADDNTPLPNTVNRY